MVKVVALRQTCWACPSQWEGETDDGREVYVRYRYGHLTVQVGTETEPDAVMSDNYIVDVEHGEGLDGFMDEDELKELTKDTIEWAV